MLQLIQEKAALHTSHDLATSSTWWLPVCSLRGLVVISTIFSASALGEELKLRSSSIAE